MSNLEKQTKIDSNNYSIEQLSEQELKEKIEKFNKKFSKINEILKPIYNYMLTKYDMPESSIMVHFDDRTEIIDNEKKQ